MNSVEEFDVWAKENCPIYRFMDLKIISVSDGLFSCTVPININTGNHINTVHAAFQLASAEMLGGLAALKNRSSQKYVPVVRGLNINFKKPAFSDITAEAHFSSVDAEKMNTALATNGRYDFDLEILIKNTDGDVVAEATGSYAVRTM